MTNERTFLRQCIFASLALVSFSCSKHRDTEACKQSAPIVLGAYQYDIKDTISEIRISHREGTEYLDAFVESGKLYIPKAILQSIKVRPDGYSPRPTNFDLYLTGKGNIAEELFGSDYSSAKVGSEYIVKGKVIGLKNSSFVFRVDSYRKIDNK